LTYLSVDFGEPPRWRKFNAMTELIGRLHPLLVHLPLGIWILLGIIMLLPIARRTEMETAIRLGIVVASLSATAAAATGWLLSRSGDYDPDTVNIHQWLGIATALAGMAAWLLPSARRALTLVTCGVMTVAGHYGGVLTHGEGYLFSSSSSQTTNTLTVTDTLNINATETTKNSGDTAIAKVFRHPFREDIQPILNSRCTNCHSATKRKGRLRLDTEAFIRQGGKNGVILKAGNPSASSLFTHLVLPMDDDMHMPPKGKPQPSEREIRILRDWIAAGAPFGPVEIKSASQTAVHVMPAPVEMPAAGPSAPDMTQESTAIEEAENTDTEDPELQTAAASFNTLGVSATVVSNGLVLNFVNLKEISPDILRTMGIHRGQISSLILRGLPLNDASISNLPDMPALLNLNLSRTNITDMAMRSLTRFTSLEQLNLYETAVSDAAIPEIARLNKLKSLNTWSTRITMAGVSTLQAQKPGLQIETGSATLRKPDSTQRKKP
jgi:hypothetical protein